MDVKNRLSRMGAGIDDGAISGLLDAAIACQLCGDHVKMTDQRFIFGAQSIQRFDVFSRNDQNMSGRPGMNILEGRY